VATVHLGTHQAEKARVLVAAVATAELSQATVELARSTLAVAAVVVMVPLHPWEQVQMVLAVDRTALTVRLTAVEVAQAILHSALLAAQVVALSSIGHKEHQWHILQK
jgi:hypothetical protein